MTNGKIGKNASNPTNRSMRPNCSTCGGMAAMGVRIEGGTILMNVTSCQECLGFLSVETADGGWRDVRVKPSPHDANNEK
jgi:hypothetical protein